MKNVCGVLIIGLSLCLSACGGSGGGSSNSGTTGAALSTPTPSVNSSSPTTTSTAPPTPPTPTTPTTPATATTPSAPSAPAAPAAPAPAAPAAPAPSAPTPSTNLPATYPAFMPPFPKLISYNSKADVIKNPVVIPVFFPSTPDQANTVKFLQKATSDANWTALAQYGVGAATVGQAVNVSQNPPAKISTAEISQFVQNNAATWTTLHGSEIFMLYYPTSTQITDNPGSGYHSSTTQTSPVVFGVIPYSSLMEDAYLQYHELVEAATDPLGGGIYLLDRDDISYSSFGMGTEIGDMCVLSDFYYSAEFGTSMKSVWLNQRIASGQSPCAASSGSLDMFGAVPIMPTSFKETYPIPNPAASNSNGAIQIPPGASKTIQVKLFSFGALPFPMEVRAIQTNINATKTNLATFSFDKTTGLNGDIVNLTITAPSAALSTSSPYVTFAIASTVTTADGAKHNGFPFPGMIVN